MQFDLSNWSENVNGKFRTTITIALVVAVVHIFSVFFFAVFYSFFSVCCCCSSIKWIQIMVFRDLQVLYAPLKIK